MITPFPRFPVSKLRGQLLAVFSILTLASALATDADTPATTTSQPAAVSKPAEALRKSFKLSAADATTTLKTFSVQSGEQIVYPVEQVRGVRTNAVSGEFTPREALEKMLADTVLTVVSDEKTGALSVKRDSDPNAEGRPANGPAAKAEMQVLKLETYRSWGRASARPRAKARRR